MTDIEALKECRLATIEEKALSRQINRLAMIGGPQGIGSQAIEPAGDRKTNNLAASKMQQIEGLIERLNRKRDENINIIQRAEMVIEKIEDRWDRIVVRYYYVEGISEYEIAREIEKSRQWVNQRRNKVLVELEISKKRKRNSRNLLN